MRKQSNPEYWEQLLSDQLSSGLTQIKWCEQNSINLHNFRYWKKRLSLGPKVEVDPSECEGKWALITPNAKANLIASSPNESSIKIQIGEAVLLVNDSVNLETLSNIVSLLMQYVQ